MKSILGAGLLKPKRGVAHGRALKYIITLLGEAHLPMVMALQNHVAKNLERADILHTFSQDFMKLHMGYRGVVLGTFIQDRLVAFRNLYYPDPQDKEWNLGLDLGLTDNALAQVVNLQMVCVHPQFRGNALAFKMNRIALGLLRKKNTHQHVCATVSPHNIWNIPVLLASGFAIAKIKNKYGGKVRYVVYQNLSRPFSFNDNSAVSVKLDHLNIQKKLLESGYLGVSLIPRQLIGKGRTANRFDLVFKKPCIENMTDSNNRNDFKMLAALGQRRRTLLSTSSSLIR